MKKEKLEQLKTRFRNAPEEVLPHIDELTGNVWYQIIDGKKVYGIPKETRTVNSPALYCDTYTGVGRTQQHLANDLTVKSLMAKYTGKHLGAGLQAADQFFRDASMDGMDYLEAQEFVQQAEREFLNIPADIRRQVGNSISAYAALSEHDRGRLFHEYLHPDVKQDDAQNRPVPPAGPSETILPQDGGKKSGASRP